MFCAAMTGNIDTASQLLDKDPSLIRCAYEYRRPMTFAVQENQLDIAAFLLNKGADPANAGTPDSLLTIALDRGYAQNKNLIK